MGALVSKLHLDAARRGFQRYCDGTSCHGYTELFYAKNLFWQIFWVIVCTVAVVLTVYQLWGAVIEYMFGATDTLIQPAEEKHILYPPLHLCFFHWLHWVNFTKVIEKGYDKDAVLYSLNYFTPIYSDEKYSVDEAEKKFIKLMKSTGHSTTLEFYNSIAREVPIKLATTNISSYFDDTKIMYEPPTFYYCYIISGPNMFRYFNDHPLLDDMEPGRKLIAFSLEHETYNRNFNGMQEFISAEEYIQYMKFWIEDNTDYKLYNDTDSQLTDFAPHFRLLPNGFDDNDVAVLEGVVDYNVDFAVSSCEWKSKPEAKCIEGESSVGSNESCEMACLAQAQKNYCYCMDIHFATAIREDKPHKICRDIFYIRSNSSSNDTPEWIEADYNISDNTQANQACRENLRNTTKFIECIDKCVIPCKIWCYAYGLVVTPMPEYARKISRKFFTNIYIEYPLSNEIITMQEQDGQSWETFVSNIGGLLVSGLEPASCQPFRYFICAVSLMWITCQSSL